LKKYLLLDNHNIVIPPQNIDPDFVYNFIYIYNTSNTSIHLNFQFFDEIQYTILKLEYCKNFQKIIS